jgi:hypothetical protein
MPGRDQDLAAAVIWCFPASSLVRGPGAHPVEPIGEVRSGVVENDEQIEEFLAFVARVAARGPCPEPAGEAVVLGAHVACRSFPGGVGHGWPPGSPILTLVAAGELAQQTSAQMRAGPSD